MLAFRLLLLSLTSLLVYAEDDLTTSIPSDLPVLLTIAPHHDDTDAAGENQRQGRMSLQAEPPSSKARREQALRNILAARRRQVLGQRPSDKLRGVTMPRPRGHIPKDTTDVLEVQESRHGLYITSPNGSKAEITVEEDADEPLTKTIAKSDPEEPRLVEEIENPTSKSSGPSKQTVETKDLGYDERTTNGPEVRHKPPSGISRSGYFSSGRNSSQYNLQRIVPAKTTATNEPDPRKNNNTVIMSESLYKHFRPVESNIPIEEMTQFLYFGQKLSPETQNTTSSNSLEVTPTLPPIVNSRRRFAMKRFSTTTPVPVPRLEEIINEEMNIAVERQTVERNKIPKIKNGFRSPSASSLYYRKSPVRPADPTIVSNVIGLPEAKNVSEGDAISNSKNDSRHDDQPANPSAHASLMHQVRGAVLDDTQVQGKGSPTSHDSNASRNAAVPTQISNETTDDSPTSRRTSRPGIGENKAMRQTMSKADAIKIKRTISGEVNHGSINGHSSGYQAGNLTSIGSKNKTSLGTPVPNLTTESSEEETTRLVTIFDETSTEETPRKVNNDRVSLASPGGSPPVVLPAQQHVYAYTITNVTRLLRNYSGPGVSSKEEGEQQGPAPAGTDEISDGSSSGIVATRSRSDLSAGSAAEGVTALVGEQVAHSSGDYGPRSDADAASRGATSIRTPLEVNKTAVKVVDSEVGESIRADTLSQTIVGSVSTDLENEKHVIEDILDVDQRMLQKSASAVLNQRPSDEPIGDRVIGKVARRRDQSRGHHFRLLSADQGRRSGEGDLAVRQSAPKEEVNNSNNKSSGIGSKETDESSQSIQPTDNVMQSHTAPRNTADPQGVNGRRSFEENSGKIAPDMLADQSMNKYSDMTDRHGANDAQVSGVTIAPLETTTLEQGEEGIDKLKSDDIVKVESDVSDVGASAISGDRDEVVSDAPVEATSGTISDRKLETATASPKESITVQSTVPPSLFPVTPRMISNANKLPEKDGGVVTTEESVTEVPAIRTPNLTEANRPFGIAEDLSPSEIQKMYRASNTMRPEAVTTLKPEVQMPGKQAQDEGEGGGEVEGEPPAITGTKFNASLSEENWNGQRTVSVERSPEVRGRNLSDKTKDKDDILPIMHLYNTTSIFNETSSLATSPSSHGTETQHAILPAVGQKDEINEKGMDSVTAALPTASSVPAAEEIAKTKIHDNAASSLHGHNPGVQRLPDSLLNKPDNSTRHNEDQGSRETPGSSSSNKGNNFTTGAGANRTRFKHPHQTPLPNLNASAFDPTVNSTYFGSSLLPPGPRDPATISEVISKRHDGDTIPPQETVAVVSYILVTLVVFPIAVGVGLILRRLIIRNRKMLEESDTSSEISCRKDALNLENGDFKTSIEKAITKLPRIQHLCHEAEKPPPPPTQESRWEFPRDKLRLQTVLGQGNFGQVWKAEADDLTGHQGTTRLVAVKTVKEGASSREKEDLVRELEIMQQLGSHPNVVTLLGCCTEEEPHYLILEYVMYGKLLAYLRDHRTRQDFYNFSEDSAALTSRDLTVFGYCVARGMEYLASKKIIHRDLAARNVLVDHNKLCKIADFGMSRFSNEDGEVIETRHGRNALPIRWMAPESLIYSLFTTKTDVWSFGILMWEIVTLGSTPYPDMTAREVMRNVQSGYRLERPSHCRSELFRVISRCWQADPDRRPDFQVLRRDLAQLLEDNMNGHYVDLESFASECTD